MDINLRSKTKIMTDGVVVSVHKNIKGRGGIIGVSIVT